jgi:hypothetical protein
MLDPLAIKLYPGLRLQGHVNVWMDSHQQHYDDCPVRALLRGSDYDLEAKVACTLRADDDETGLELSVLDIGFLAYTCHKFRDPDCPPFSMVSAIATLSLACGYLSFTLPGLPSYAMLTHTWEIVSVYRAIPLVAPATTALYNPRAMYRLDPCAEATPEPYDWERQVQPPQIVLDCRLVRTGEQSVGTQLFAPATPHPGSA